MKKLNNVLIFLCSLAAACFFVRDLNVSSYDRLLGDITIPLVLLLPRIFSKLFKIKITSAMELVYVIFIILAQFIGSVVNLYNKVWWYDLFTHFLSGVLTSILALVVLNWFGIYKEKIEDLTFIYNIIYTYDCLYLGIFRIWSGYILWHERSAFS